MKRIYSVKHLFISLYGDYFDTEQSSVCTQKVYVYGVPRGHNLIIMMLHKYLWSSIIIYGAP